MIMDAILATAGSPERRAGHQVAFCTVDHIMGVLGRNGIRRGKAVRTTIQAPTQIAPATSSTASSEPRHSTVIWVVDFP
jgi:putative transposase